MKKKISNIVILLLIVLILVLAIWWPEKLAEYKDNRAFNQVIVETVENPSEGYRYSMSSNEKLYILSECLSNQVLPESEMSAITKVESEDMNYEELTGTYAFVINHQGPSDKQITEKEIFVICNEGIEELKKLGILPEAVKSVNASSYSAILYSAIDVLEPRNNLSVWKVSLSTSQQNAKKDNRLLDAYIDADTGKIYEFYVRTELDWEDVNADELVEKWSNYLGLTGREEYEDVNPLLETTPYYKKYKFSGMDNGNTVVTVGFYEGIKELFLKISR
uniref:hypothetical protein n=1 Tax=Acetatifactor sp. TaxID=1872090 RepID=UPI0040567A85